MYLKRIDGLPSIEIGFASAQLVQNSYVADMAFVQPLRKVADAKPDYIRHGHEQEMHFAQVE